MSGITNLRTSRPSRWNERILAGDGDRVRNIAVSPDGSRIASAGGDQTARIWDTETGENLLTLTGHKSYVEAVEFSHDGRHVATASRDRTVKFWKIEGHTNTVTSISFSPNGRMLAAGSSDRTARLWDLSSGKPRLLHILEGHTDQVSRIAFNPEGTLLATASFDNSVKLWNIPSGQEAEKLLKKHGDQVRDVAFSPDGKRLASVGADGLAWLYHLNDLDSPDMQATKVTHYEKDWAQASAVAFHPQRDQWATGGYDGKLRLWDFLGKNVGTIALPSTFSENDRRFIDIAFNPDGAIIAALTRRLVHLWPVTAFERPQSEPSITLTIEGTGRCNAITCRHDGEQLALACNDSKVRIYDMAKLKLAKTITVHRDAVSDVAYSPDGTKLATASLDKSFHVSPLHFNELYEMAKRLKAATSGQNP